MDTQTSQATDRTIPPNAEVERAQAQLVRLNEVAADAETEAARWETSFRKEPTEQAHVSAAVARQKATNARAEATRFEAETLTPLVAKHQAALDDAERAELTESLDWSQAEHELGRMEQAVYECRRELGEAATILAAFLAHRRSLHARANRLGMTVPPASFERLVQGVHARLGAKGNLRFHINGNDTALVLDLTVPTSVNGYDR